MQTESAIQLVDEIINQAIDKNASDVHIEPYSDYVRIRYRIDGILHEITHIDLNLSDRISARLKIMANLDVAERRLPQDGRFTISYQQQRKECRISSCPTVCGEKIVIRILNSNQTSLSTDDLGMEKQQLKLFNKAINHPQGMILVTGPTGSGKTVSLYAALNKLNTIDKNIITIEDPVEIKLQGINQVQTNRKIDLTFASALRTFLRQDPDIIMVGEIRDLETAEIAVKAAQTGHLVLSTLHTNSSADSITRLLNLGIAPFNINNTLLLVITQRLIRLLCPHCKKPQHLSKNTLLEAGFEKSKIDDFTNFQAVGCEKCYKGYRGRIGIFETMLISEQINQLIAQHANAAAIQKTALKNGMLSLRKAALNKLSRGLTSLEEISRVI